MLKIFKNSDYGLQNIVKFKYSTYNSPMVSCGMKEDIFATSRNGHLLKDTYDKDANSLDIRSNGLYPANVLSNLAHNEFVFDGIQCGSIEGVLQSLKVNDSEKQKEICALYGGSAKKISSKHKNWQDSQTLYWQGKEFKRDSFEYKEFLKRVFKECYLQNDVYRTALDSTKGKKLTHKDGKTNIKETVLSASEFVEILTDTRDNY